MIHALIGQKKTQTQRFLSDGTRIPVTEINLAPNPVISIKTLEKDSYDAIQVGLGVKKHPSKALVGHIKGAMIQNAPAFLREVKLSDTADMPKVGDMIKAIDVFKPGDTVDVIGISKGKGFAGGVKRHGFKGGPRTHGQSDRERAPGSIGQTTTPGRVYKGKRMAGRMGTERVTVKNLSVVAVLDDAIWIKGLVPGGRDNLIYIKKVGENKKFVPLIDEPKIEMPKVVEEVETVATAQTQPEADRPLDEKEEAQNAS